MSAQPATVDRVRPGRIATAFNDTVAWLARRGISVYGARELAVRGRTSGEWRTVPVNVLRVDEDEYLLAPRGETQWVKNVRVAGTGELRLGSRAEAFAATEITDEALAITVLRAYLRKWAWEIGAFFPGLAADSTDAELAAATGRYPMFVLSRS